MEHLLMEVENEIAVVTINNPKSLNALNSATLAELNECFTDIPEQKRYQGCYLNRFRTEIFRSRC